MARIRFVTLIALLLAVVLAGCGRPGTEVTRSPEPTPSPAIAPAPTPAPVSPTSSPPPERPTTAPLVTASPKPPPPKTASPKPSPSPTVDIGQMKRQLESEMRGMVDTIHTFTAGAYRMYSPTTAQQSSNVTWKSGQHAEFSFAGEIFYFTLPADPVASAQKRVETAYASLTSQSTNLTDEALVRGVLDEVQKAVNDCKLQVMMSSVYEKAMSDTVRKWDLAPSVNRKVTEEDKNSGIASLAAWYTRYRRELNDVGTRLSGIASYSTRLPPVTTPKTQPY